MLTDKDLKELESQALDELPDELPPGMEVRKAGPCGDSFCYASCDILSCHPASWLASNSDEHNARRQALIEKNPVLQLVREVRRLRRKVKKLSKEKE